MEQKSDTSVTENNTGTAYSKEERNWAMLCHLIAVAGFIIPFANLFGPLVIWLIKKDEFPLVNDQGKESVNFQITITIYVFISIILIFVVIGILLIIAVVIFNLIVIIIATINI